MRSPHRLVLALVGAAACQATPTDREPFPAPDLEMLVQEAALSRAPQEVRLVDAANQPNLTFAAEPATAELLAAALQTNEQLRQLCLDNIANVNTAGFKKRTAAFGSRSIEADGQTFTVPVLLGGRPVFTTGTLESTDRCLDLAIDGDGLFAVTLPDGHTGYSRDGGLQINKDGKLVTGQGYVLVPGITLPSDLLELSIDAEGHVSGRTAGNPDVSTQFGQLTLTRFLAPDLLQDDGHGVWLASGASGPARVGYPGTDGLGTLKQGFVERSNVTVTNELVNLSVLERNRQSLLLVARHFGFVLEQEAP